MARLRVRQVAEAQQLDRAKLARRADVTYVTISRIWENPDHDVSFNVLKKIADALGVSVDDLIEDTREDEK